MAEDVNIEETADKLVNPAVETKAVKITDAIMDDREYKSKVKNCVKKICEVEINRRDNMKRKDVIEYFEKKNNVMEKVLRCDN